MRNLTMMTDFYELTMSQAYFKAGKKDEIAVFSTNGLGKRISLTEIPLQKRAGKGLVCYKPTDATGLIAAAALVEDEDLVLILGDTNSICIEAKEIPTLGRASIGNQIIKNSKIRSVSKV